MDIDRLLTRAELKYETDDDDDYKVLMEVENGRTQLVFISGETEDCNDTDVRHIWSIACEDVDSLSSNVLPKCMKNNSDYPIGAWELTEENTLIFCVKTVDSFDADDLSNIISFVAETADRFEKKFVGDDEF